MDLLQAHQAGILNLQKQQQQDAQQAAMIAAIPGLLSKFNKDKWSGYFPGATQTETKDATGAPINSENVTSAILSNPSMGVDDIMQAIGKFESSGNYSAIGPSTRGGDRALGKYQIMASNLPSWSKEALGYTVDRSNFLANPQLQDAIAQYQMQKYYNKYGNPQDVASMWFSGRPSRNNFSKDVLGTSVPQYVSGVMKYL